MKTASIYKLPKKGYIIFGSSKTISGLRIASAPFFNLQEDSDTDVIVNAIKASLCNDDSKRIADPKDWKESGKDFLQNIGLKSSRELNNPSNKCVSISADENIMTFKPTRPADKPDKGFLHKPNEAVITSFTATNQDLITAYELALSRCG